MPEVGPVLLLADIHANEAALIAAVEHYRSLPSSAALRAWFLGDLFGRGPNPVQVWRRLMDLYEVEGAVIGNHDRAVLGQETVVQTQTTSEGGFGPTTDWPIILDHRQQLSDVGLLQLDDEQLPTEGRVFTEMGAWPLLWCPQAGVWLLHGGWVWPLEAYELGPSILEHAWGYVRKPEHARHTLSVLSWLQAQPLEFAERLQGMPTPPRLVIVGHTHQRFIYWAGEDCWETDLQMNHPYPLDLDRRGPVVLSPGSVGFPREAHGQREDRDASYAVLEFDEGSLPSQVTFQRASYRREAVRSAMKQRGYAEAVIRYLRLPDERDNWMIPAD